VRWLVPVLIVGIVCPTVVAAGDNYGRWGVGLQGGLHKLVAGAKDYSNFAFFGALSLDYGLSEKWTLEGAFKYGYTRPGVANPDDSAGWTTDSYTTFYTELIQPTLRARYHFAPYSSVNPFLGIGAGATIYRVLDLEGKDPGLILDGPVVVGFDEDGRQADLEGTHFTLAFEGGIDFYLSDSFAINAGLRYYVLAGVDRDNVGLSSQWGADDVDANSGLFEGFLGLTYWFSSPDGDGDGILDTEDACPSVKEDIDGFEDDDGCPDLDNDGDKVPDLSDGCPLDAEDVDGFQDDDGCPEPDNDLDGILDADDECPDDAEDYNGFQDADGCPDRDTDRDGVPDERDQCPATPAGVQVGPDGCPVASTFAEELVLEGVNFVSGSAELTPDSVAALALVAESLRVNPDVKVEVRGHTDSTGSAEINRDVSHRRANAVRDVLIQFGIHPERITAVGYGEDYPIADNSTREGRAQNRRVELHRLR
jgi:outer membrane protein OmpA-like peptidoglycan-associated protein/opacity protein-like surface antigen